MKLFLTGFLQVFLVTVQTWMIAKGNILGVCLFAFLISFVWSWNVKRVVFGSIKDAAIYSAGASAGATIGLISAMAIK
jgi:hypothetical protein